MAQVNKLKAAQAPPAAPAGSKPAKRAPIRPLGNGGDSIARFPKKGKNFKGEGNPTYWAELYEFLPDAVVVSNFITCLQLQWHQRCFWKVHSSGPDRDGARLSHSGFIFPKRAPSGFPSDAPPQDDADIRPVGSGRDDPNRDPEMPRSVCDASHETSACGLAFTHLCARPDRVKWSLWHPMDILADIMGPHLFGKFKRYMLALSLIMSHSLVTFCRCLIFCLSATFSILYFIGRSSFPPPDYSHTIFVCLTRRFRAAYWRQRSRRSCRQGHQSPSATSPAFQVRGCISFPVNVCKVRVGENCLVRVEMSPQ